MTWTAVVGSFTAGDRARFAMSTMMRIEKAGSWVEGALVAERDHAP